MRLAVLHTGLGREGPGLLLRDIRAGVDDVRARIAAILTIRPDILLLLDFDHDHEGVALAAFAGLLADGGHPMPHRHASRPNSGLATGIDLDGDGRRSGPEDAQGWGRFSGSGGMALLSRFPLDDGAVVDHTGFLWRDLPGSRLPVVDGRVFPSVEAAAIQRLASVAAWEIPVRAPGGTGLRLLLWHAGPPAFDGPEGRNRLRNADETAFWRLRLDGRLGPAPDAPLVLMGNANLDPDSGNGLRDEIRALLAHPAVQDPRPRGRPPVEGAPDTVTAFWPRGPGALRVDYVLPSSGLRVLDAGLHWPAPDATHALVWVEIGWPP